MNLDGGVATEIAVDPVSRWLSLLRPDCLLTQQVNCDSANPVMFRGETRAVGVVTRGRWRINREADCSKRGTRERCDEGMTERDSAIEIGPGDVVLILFGGGYRVESLGADSSELMWGRVSIQSYAADIELDGFPHPLVVSSPMKSSSIPSSSIPSSSIPSSAVPYSTMPTDRPADRQTAAVLELIRAEVQWRRDGWIGAVNQLLRLLVMAELRNAAEKLNRFGPGWLGAFRDAEMTPVLAAMIENPAKDWTVASLAEIGMYSRSHFAKRFREVVGTTPMDALYSLRMQTAELLQADGIPAKEIARRVGYRSIAAFLAAFRRREPTGSRVSPPPLRPSERLPQEGLVQENSYAEASNPTSK